MHLYSFEKLGVQTSQNCIYRKIPGLLSLFLPIYKNFENMRKCTGSSLLSFLLLKTNLHQILF